MVKFFQGPGTGGGGPSIDRFAPRIVVGNVPAGDSNVSQGAPFQYIPDPGDGSGLAAAITALAATGGRIYVRRGTYTFGGAGSPALPLVVPSGVLIEGESGGGEGGRGSSTNLVAPGGATAQDMFQLSANAALERVRITVPANSGGAPGGAGVVQLLGAGARFAHAHIDMSGASQRNTALAVSTGTGVVDVTDMVVDSVDVDLPTVVSTGAVPYVAVVLGFTGQDCTGNTTEPIVRNVRTTGGQGGVWMLNIFGGVVDGLRSTNMLLSTTTLGVWWDAGGSALTTLQGPTILNPSLVFGTGSGSIDLTAIKVSSSYTGGASLTVTGTRIVAPFVRFTDVTTVGARVAIKIRIETNGTAQLVKGSISGGTSIGHEIGVLYSTRTANNVANTVGAVNDWTASSRRTRSASAPRRRAVRCGRSRPRPPRRSTAAESSGATSPARPRRATG